MKQIKIAGMKSEAYLLVPDDNRAKQVEDELRQIVNGLLKIVDDSLAAQVGRRKAQCIVEKKGSK